MSVTARQWHDACKLVVGEMDEGGEGVIRALVFANYQNASKVGQRSVVVSG
jgi:hypothetical protein